MAMSTDDKLALDTQLMDVYLTGIQSEIEAKLRRVAKFREEMRKIDDAGRRSQPGRGSSCPGPVAPQGLRGEYTSRWRRRPGPARWPPEPR